MSNEEIALELVKLIVNDQEKTSFTKTDLESKADDVIKAYNKFLKNLEDNLNAKNHN